MNAFYNLKIVMLYFLMLTLSSHAQTTYEVVMVKGKVTYNGEELFRGARIEFNEIEKESILERYFNNFSFSSNNDAVHLLDIKKRKVIVVPAQIMRSGRDLMLATRGVKYIRSDFEFQRAFSPGDFVIVLLSEDTLICRGLQNYKFNDNKVLIANFQYLDNKFSKIIGRNDTLYLTRNHLFGYDSEQGIGLMNSFDISNIFFVIASEGCTESPVKQLNIEPFNLYFLEDIISYFVSVSYDDVVIDVHAIYNILVPNFINERQIQREFNLFTEEEARKWLLDKISKAF